MSKKDKSTEILYVDEKKNSVIVSRGNSERGYSFFESKLKKGKNNKIVLSSVSAIDNIFDYIEIHHINLSELQKSELMENIDKVDKNEKVK